MPGGGRVPWPQSLLILVHTQHHRAACLRADLHRARSRGPGQHCLLQQHWNTVQLPGPPGQHPCRCRDEQRPTLCVGASRALPGWVLGTCKHHLSYTQNCVNLCCCKRGTQLSLDSKAFMTQGGLKPSQPRDGGWGHHLVSQLAKGVL